MKRFRQYLAIAVSTALICSTIIANGNIIQAHAESMEVSELTEDTGYIEALDIVESAGYIAESEAVEATENTDNAENSEDSPEVMTEEEYKAELQKTAVEQFCKRLYQTCLNRAADSSGLNYWTEGLLSGKFSGAKAAYSFVFSPEYTAKNVSDEVYVDMLYTAFMDRTADANGKAYWVNYLNQGLSREYVFNGFCSSAEFDRICTSYGITRGNLELKQYRDQNPKLTMFMNRLYVEVMGRSGDAGGLNSWCKIILEKEKTPIEVAQIFFQTKEFMDKEMTDSEYVQVLYRAYMDRQYDETGLNSWLSKMEAGTTRDQVRSFFETSEEFRNILISYGLPTEVHYYPWTHKDDLTGLMGILEDAPVDIKKSGCERLDDEVQAFLSKCTSRDMSRSEQLEAAYDYMVDNYTYKYNYNYSYADFDGNRSAAWAYVFFRDGYGSCNNWNAAFMYVAWALGYDAHLYYGSTGSSRGGWTEHYWAVIRIDGSEYAFDPQVERDMTRRSGNNIHARFGLTGSAASAKFRYKETIM